MADELKKIFDGFKSYSDNFSGRMDTKGKVNIVLAPMSSGMSRSFPPSYIMREADTPEKRRLAVDGWCGRGTANWMIMSAEIEGFGHERVGKLVEYFGPISA